MLIHVFKTNISESRLPAIKPVFDSLPQVSRWTVDTQDIDRILRIESNDSLNEQDVVALSKIFCFHCEPLD